MGGSSAGGGRATRALRLLLLLVLALAAVEYLFGSILDASPLRTYLYTPLYNATQPTLRNAERLMSHWPKKMAVITSNDILIQNRTNSSLYNNSNVNTTRIDITNVTNINNTISNITSNMTGLDVTNISTPSLLITKVLEGIKKSVTTEKPENSEITESNFPMCDITPPDLGPVPADKNDMELDLVETKYPEIQSGGIYSPPNCTARHRVAIIVPYRDREQHLAIFLNHMHPFLMKQQIEYGIFIVEQEGDKPFNRAKLMNVGFVESQRLRRWQCFVFHDIDLLPLDTRNMYSCPKQPRHMSAAIDKFNFKLPYDEIFGGVSALTLEQFVKVNGFSNKYWGWGGEDDDMHSRIAKMNYHVARYKMSIARYAMLNHKKSAVNPKRYQLLSQTKKVFRKDGLSTLVYEVVKVTQHHLYTHLYVNIDERS